MKTQSLPVLGFLFLSAFIGRAFVLAAEASETAPSQASVARSAQTCLTGALAEELQNNIDALETRRAGLAEDEGAIAASRQHANDRIADLEKLNASISEKLNSLESAQKTEMKRIASIYEQMKPALASAIFTKMDPKFAAGLLMSMNEETASAILSGLDSSRAYSITVLMTSQAMAVGGAS